MTADQMRRLKAGSLSNREIYKILEKMGQKPKLRSQSLMEEQLLKALLMKQNRRTTTP